MFPQQCSPTFLPKSQHLHLLNILILFCLHAAVPEKEKCKVMEIPDLQGVVKQGDIMLAGFFGVHSTKPTSVSTFRETFKTREFRYTMAMIFAIEEINKSNSLLRNVTLGYMIYDACFIIQKSVKATVNFIGSEMTPMRQNICKPRAIIGSATSSFSVIVGRFIGPFSVPLISYAATCKCLSDKKEYPSFLRTVPSDAFQSTAMAHLVSHFHWIFLGALQNDDDYGKQGIFHFLFYLQYYLLNINKTLICIISIVSEIFIFIIIRKTLSLTSGETVEKSRVSVIVVFSGESRFSPFVEELWKRNITGKIWIASEDWATFKSFASERLAHIFQGTLGFALQRGSIPGFYEFLVNRRPFFQNALSANVTLTKKYKCVASCLQEQLELYNNQTMNGISNKRKLLHNIMFKNFSNKNMGVTYRSYTATYAVAHALHDLQQCIPGQGPLDNGTCAMITNFKSWQVTREQIII
uniref:Receptor ligand binding region domain-containing protein n=1 Tax=Eptatretus burgeri TaxID=7764 RepID=A0A8C4PZD3_EPTBU